MSELIVNTKKLDEMYKEWRGNESCYDNGRPIFEADELLDFAEFCLRHEANDVNKDHKPSINYNGLLGTVDSDIKEETDKILTAILYKHSCSVEMCVNEIDYEEVVKDIREHFFQ